MSNNVTLRNAFKQPDDTLMCLIKEILTGEEQELFVEGYKQFIMADQADFVVDFEFAVGWLGFTRKDNAKAKLVKELIEGVDFKKLLLNSQEQGGSANCTGRNLGGAGLNKDNIMLTVRGFKSFSMLAGTEKAKRVRQYYITIVDVMFAYIEGRAGRPPGHHGCQRED